jgi:phosphocarrier protein FPr/phosphocarrier protein
MSGSEVVLLAPLCGWLTPLEEVPDPVFAERMMGDGVAIDPVQNVLHSPADATVIAIPESAHAVTLRLENGAELLIHIGLETVALAGAGFRALRSNGAEVKAGDPLIEFDLDQVAHHVRSLVTPMVVASEDFSLEIDRCSRSVSKGDPIGRIRGSAQVGSTAAHGETVERSVTVEAAHGLHARPAARVAALLRLERAERGRNARPWSAQRGGSTDRRSWS